MVLEICGKCKESDEIVNRLSSWTFESTARTKSSLTTDGRPLRASSCTFSRPSRNCLTHFLTIPSLMAFSPYTSHIWRWMSAGFTFLAYKKTDYRPYFTVGGPLDHLKHFKRTEQNGNMILCPRNGVWVLLIDEGSQCTCAKRQHQCCSGNICNWYLLSEYASY
jgi:hypothetical protein